MINRGDLFSLVDIKYLKSLLGNTCESQLSVISYLDSLYKSSYLYERNIALNLSHEVTTSKEICDLTGIEMLSYEWGDDGLKLVSLVGNSDMLVIFPYLVRIKTYDKSYTDSYHFTVESLGNLPLTDIYSHISDSLPLEYGLTLNYIFDIDADFSTYIRFNLLKENFDSFMLIYYAHDGNNISDAFASVIGENNMYDTSNLNLNNLSHLSKSELEDYLYENCDCISYIVDFSNQTLVLFLGSLEEVTEFNLFNLPYIFKNILICFESNLFNYILNVIISSSNEVPYTFALYKNLFEYLLKNNFRISTVRMSDSQKSKFKKMKSLFKAGSDNMELWNLFNSLLVNQ